jgi:lipopolysaccharide transport system ATP-binding protein
MVAVSVEHVSKSYRLGSIGGASLQDDFERFWARLRGRPDPLTRVGGRQEPRLDKKTSSFLALDDVSFEVFEGEVLGIIGRNGAGKSTLLKILSQVTGPTAGAIRVRGRIASLLEVGTGFHTELTGRENIFLNGAILGMTKAEIRGKLDEIIAFSGVEEFIDTPVKRYSSGMNVRLAFAVAAHLDPEILVIDEVLAVGDAAFQKKCLGKMSDVARGGRTILFVSHDLTSVSRLCHRTVLLNAGRVEAIGTPPEIIAQYTAGDSVSGNGYADLSVRADRSGSGDAMFRTAELIGPAGRTEAFEFGQPLTVRLEIDVQTEIGPALAAVSILTENGSPVHDMYNIDGDCSWVASPGGHVLSVTIPALRLYPARYVVELWLGDQSSNRLDYVRNALSFRVVQTDSTLVNRQLDSAGGVVYEPSVWRQEGRAQ